MSQDMNQTISVISGDGIGPEIMDACLRILEAAGAELEYEHVNVGEKVYLAGNTSGIEPDCSQGTQMRFRHC